MHIHNLSQQVGGLVVKELISILGVQRRVPTNDMGVVNVKMLTEYSLPT
jgi:hypothetical protein